MIIIIIMIIIFEFFFLVPWVFLTVDYFLSKIFPSNKVKRFLKFWKTLLETLFIAMSSFILGISFIPFWHKSLYDPFISELKNLTHLNNFLIGYLLKLIFGNVRKSVIKLIVFFCKIIVSLLFFFYIIVLPIILLIEILYLLEVGLNFEGLFIVGIFKFFLVFVFVFWFFNHQNEKAKIIFRLNLIFNFCFFSFVRLFLLLYLFLFIDTTLLYEIFKFEYIINWFSLENLQILNFIFFLFFCWSPKSLFELIPLKNILNLYLISSNEYLMTGGPNLNIPSNLKEKLNEIKVPSEIIKIKKKIETNSEYFNTFYKNLIHGHSLAAEPFVKTVLPNIFLQTVPGYNKVFFTPLHNIPLNFQKPSISQPELSFISRQILSNKEFLENNFIQHKSGLSIKELLMIESISNHKQYSSELSKIAMVDESSIFSSIHKNDLKESTRIFFETYCDKKQIDEPSQYDCALAGYKNNEGIPYLTANNKYNQQLFQYYYWCKTNNLKGRIRFTTLPLKTVGNLNADFLTFTPTGNIFLSMKSYANLNKDYSKVLFYLFKDDYIKIKDALGPINKLHCCLDLTSAFTSKSQLNAQWYLILEEKFNLGNNITQGKVKQNIIAKIFSIPDNKLPYIEFYILYPTKIID